VAGCTDINACLTNACGANATCSDLPAPALGDAAGRTCACDLGYEGNAALGCTDIDECEDDWSLCDHEGAYCDNYAGGYQCVCEEEYEEEYEDVYGDGSECVRMDDEEEPRLDTPMVQSRYYCGPDLTCALAATLDEFIRAFPSRSGSCRDFASQVSPAQGVTGWDISGLYQAANISTSDAKCGIGSGAEKPPNKGRPIGENCTVIGGKRVWRPELNYVLWGLVTGLCREPETTAYGKVLAYKTFRWVLGDPFEVTVELEKWFDIGRAIAAAHRVDGKSINAAELLTLMTTYNVLDHQDFVAANIQPCPYEASAGVAVRPLAWSTWLINQSEFREGGGSQQEVAQAKTKACELSSAWLTAFEAEASKLRTAPNCKAISLQFFQQWNIAHQGWRDTCPQSAPRSAVFFEYLEAVLNVTAKSYQALSTTLCTSPTSDRHFGHVAGALVSVPKRPQACDLSQQPVRSALANELSRRPAWQQACVNASDTSGRELRDDEKINVIDIVNGRYKYDRRQLQQGCEEACAFIYSRRDTRHIGECSKIGTAQTCCNQCKSWCEAQFGSGRPTRGASPPKVEVRGVSGGRCCVCDRTEKYAPGQRYSYAACGRTRRVSRPLTLGEACKDRVTELLPVSSDGCEGKRTFYSYKNCREVKGVECAAWAQMSDARDTMLADQICSTWGQRVIDDAKAAGQLESVCRLDGSGPHDETLARCADHAANVERTLPVGQRPSREVCIHHCRSWMVERCSAPARSVEADEALADRYCSIWGQQVIDGAHATGQLDSVCGPAGSGARAETKARCRDHYATIMLQEPRERWPSADRCQVHCESWMDERCLGYRRSVARP